MNLEKIKEILDQKILPREVKERAIIQILADDSDCLPLMIKIIHQERLLKNEMLNELNIMLGEAHIYIVDTKVNSQKKTISREFILKQICDFYKKYKGKIIHHFTRCAWGNENLKDIYETKD